MKKIVLTSLMASSLLLAADLAVDQEKLQVDIAAAKAEQSAAEAKVKSLEAQLPQNQDIISNAKLGYMKTDGNTQTETFSLDGSFKKAWGDNSASLTFDTQYGKALNTTTNKMEKTKEKYFAELEYGYLVSSSITANVVIGYKNDKFSSYDSQLYVGPGLKYAALKSERQALDLSASLLYSNDKLKGTDPDFQESYASYKAKALYELKIVDNLKFNQELSYRASFDDANNYFVFSNSTLSSKISDIFSAGISYKVDYTNLVVAGIEKTDTTLAAFLSLDY